MKLQYFLLLEKVDEVAHDMGPEYLILMPLNQEVYQETEDEISEVIHLKDQCLQDRE